VELDMRTRQLMLAVAALSLASTAFAQPANAPVRKAEQATVQSAPVVVASADEIATPPATDQQQASAPAKPVRHARVTTCRCGDQTPGDQTPGDQN
jgi:hypothetical protein